MQLFQPAFSGHPFASARFAASPWTSGPPAFRMWIRSTPELGKHASRDHTPSASVVWIFSASAWMAGSNSKRRSFPLPEPPWVVFFRFSALSVRSVVCSSLRMFPFSFNTVSSASQATLEEVSTLFRWTTRSSCPSSSSSCMSSKPPMDSPWTSTTGRCLSGSPAMSAFLVGSMQRSIASYGMRLASSRVMILRVSVLLLAVDAMPV
eukprot:scaffold846_cov336-Pavlova_lutheri.AAC.5